MNAKNAFSISEERRRILLVEDDYVNQETLKATLGDVYEIVIAETGEEALETIQDQYETLSIVLLDLNLPGIQGIDVLDLLAGGTVVFEVRIFLPEIFFQYGIEYHDLIHAVVS